MQAQATQNPVVVELFTSEGCSSCPPADALLVQLSQQQAKDGTQLILMGEHVDYWNYIGWTDRFSAKQFSQRQSEYASALHAQVYTPQMVIDGQEHPAPAGTFARVDPSRRRTVRNTGSESCSVLIVSAPTTSGYQPMEWA